MQSPVHPEDADNLAFEARTGDGIHRRRRHQQVSAEFRFGRHTGVLRNARRRSRLESRDETLTVYASHQTPWQQRGRLRPIRTRRTPGQGPVSGCRRRFRDQAASTATRLPSPLSRLLRRPVKFIADRLESFVARAFRDRVFDVAKADDGVLRSIEVDAIGGIGPYSAYRRVSIGEGMMNMNLTGAPYAMRAYAGRFRAAFQNRPTVAMYRAVGQPIATAVTEQLVDLAAAEAGTDPAEFRRNSYLRAGIF